jgi:hypothetical protein
MRGVLVAFHPQVDRGEHGPALAVVGRFDQVLFDAGDRRLDVARGLGRGRPAGERLVAHLRLAVLQRFDAHAAQPTG